MDTVDNTLTASTLLRTLIIILPPHRTRRDRAREQELALLISHC